MKLVIISGRSGSGKSSALHALEDEGYYCVDNIPVGILDQLPATLTDTHSTAPAMAVSIDVRNVPGAMEDFPEVLAQLRSQGIDCKVIFLDADTNSLLMRYSSTRRKHPLTNEHCSLAEAIEYEKRLLGPVQSQAPCKRASARQTRRLGTQSSGSMYGIASCDAAARSSSPITASHGGAPGGARAISRRAATVSCMMPAMRRHSPKKGAPRTNMFAYAESGYGSVPFAGMSSAAASSDARNASASAIAPRRAATSAAA